MKSKTKVFLSSILVVVLALTVVLTVAIVFAATNQTITSNISVTYTSKEVVGTATARWSLMPDWEWFDMQDAGGSTEIKFDLEELKGASLSPNQELTIENLNDYIVLEYYFTNEGTKPYTLALSYQDDDIKDENVILRTMVGPVTDSVTNSWTGYTARTLIESCYFETFTGEINTVVLPDSQTAIYILLEVENWGADASFSGTMNFKLDGTAIDEYTEDFLYYTNGETATLTGVAKGNPEDVDGINIFVWDDLRELDVPLTYDGFPVKTIGPYAFMCQETLTSITNFGNVENIGMCAFYDCSLAGDMVIPGTVKNIFGGFCDRDGITSLTLQEGVETLGEYAFARTGLNELIINSVKTIEENAFYGCENLTSITIGSSVVDIAVNPFHDCKQLTKIVVDSGNARFTSKNSTNTECNVIIDKTAKTLISGCNNSTIPQDGSITKIGDYAFYNCEDLTDQLIIPQGVISIGEFAFYLCKFTSVIIPSSLKQISFCAFGFCQNLANVTIDSQAACQNLIEWENGGSSWINGTATSLIDHATTIKAKYEIVGIESYSRKFTKSPSKDGDGYWTYTYNG